MAAALVGGAFLSSFVNVLFDRMASPEVINWLKGKKLDQKLLGRLETSLCVVQAVLNDAEQRQITDSAVKKWLTNLEDAVYKADDLLDEVRTKAATIHKDPGNIWTRYFNNQDTEMVSRIQEVIETLEELAKHKDILKLKEIENVNFSGRTPSTSLVDKSEIFGRDKDKEAIIELLLSDASDDGVSVIPVVGMGGIGKTTLAQLVYNDDRLEGKFDCKAWVCVGEEFDIVKVTKTILEAVSSSSCDKNDFSLLQNDLKKMLSANKFLIVLDDMWNDRPDEWKILRQPFLYGNKGSKILVTTRSDNVAFVVRTIRTYRLELLAMVDCWSMFVKHAFHSTESLEFSTLEEIGRKIVEKCKGLPLAIETLGSLLRTNYDANYWDNILKSEIWQISEDKIRIIPALRISYHYLPSHLKRCFVFCSLYPKDYEFDKDELILLWMAEEFFVQPNGIQTLEEIGDEYFNELVARSFFQPSNTDQGLFVMHDLMHDLATLCAGEFYFRDEPENAIKFSKVSIKTRHLSHNVAGNNYPISKLLAACDRVEHSRTFLEVNLRKWDPFNMEDAPSILLSHLMCLRVLSFNSFPLGSLPHSIGELIHMRYLDLSHTTIVTLPESLSRLYNLQTLKLRDCYKLETLPSGMQNLVNLRHLDIRGTYLEEMPKGMRKMKDLQFLSYYVVGKHVENKIGELGALVNLHGSLSISNIEKVINGNEALEARMSDKKYVKSLDLKWSSNGNIVDSHIERDILDKLQPHRDLKQLSVDGYRGTMFPDWLGYSLYKHMTHLTLDGCENCCMLPSLGQLPSLNHLSISNFDCLIRIGAEFYRDDDSCWETPFPSLETLIFDELECWEEWCSIEFENAFPQLKELEIMNCPKLIGDLPIHLPALVKLTIDKTCEKLDCFLPRAPAMLELKIDFVSGLRIQELPPSICSVHIKGTQLVESLFEAMSHTQPTCLQSLSIEECDSAISFPDDCIPASLQSLEIWGCKKLHFPTQNQQQHESLNTLGIAFSCDSLISFPLSPFPNLSAVNIVNCRNMESLEVSQSHDASNSSLCSLKIFDCPNFVSLSTLGMAAPQLDSLEIVECPEIDSFGVDEVGLPPKLRKLNILLCEKLGSRLASMDLRSHGLTRLTIRGASESVKSFPKEGCLPASLESLSLLCFQELGTLDCKGLSHLTSLKSLCIFKCPLLKNMMGERLPASLKRLEINECPLLVEQCKEEKDSQIWPIISHIPNIEVDRRMIKGSRF